MSIGMGVSSVVFGASDGDLNTAADLLTFTPAKPIDVLRYGVIIDGATASGTTLVLSLDKRPTAGSDTSRSEITTLTPSATLAQGKGCYKDMTSRQSIDPGEEVVVEVKTAAGVAATGRVFIEFIERPFVKTSADSTEDRLANMTEITS